MACIARHSILIVVTYSSRTDFITVSSFNLILVVLLTLPCLSFSGNSLIMNIGLISSLNNIHGQRITAALQRINRIDNLFGSTHKMVFDRNAKS